MYYGSKYIDNCRILMNTYNITIILCSSDETRHMQRFSFVYLSGHI